MLVSRSTHPAAKRAANVTIRPVVLRSFMYGVGRSVGALVIVGARVGAGVVGTEVGTGVVGAGVVGMGVGTVVGCAVGRGEVVGCGVGTGVGSDVGHPLSHESVQT